MHRLLATSVLIALAGCRLGDLIDTPASGPLAISPRQFRLTATVGSTIPVRDSLTVAQGGTSPVDWVATKTRSWLSLSDNGGETPSRVTVSLSPADLDTGVYRDSILFTTDPPGPDSTFVHVRFTIEECSVSDLALDADVRATLSTGDCPAPHRGGHLARLYRFTGSAGETVSFFVGSSEFDASVLLDTSLAPNAPPIAQADGCWSDGRDACIRLHTLPLDGSYFIEVTTAATGETGAFTLQATRPRTPRAPTGAAQLKSNGTTPIDVGAATDETAATLRAVVGDPDTMDVVALEVEVRPVGTTFTGEPTGAASNGRTGDTLTVRLEGLEDNTGYHWRTRTADASGRRSPWVSFGANAETAPDFRVSVPAARLEFTVPPSTATAGQPITPAVEVTARSTSGQTAASFTGTVTMTLAPNTFGASLGGTLSVQAVGGVARFSNLIVDKAGTGYRLVATTAGLESITSESFNVLPLGTGSVAFVGEPGDAQAGQSIPNVQVEVRDAAGQVDPTFVGEVTVDLGANPSGATLAGDRTVNAVAGIATFTDLTINRAGTGYTLVAAVAGLTSDTSAPFNITEPPAPVATRLTFSQDPTDADTAEIIAPPVTVTALAATGNPVPYTGNVTVAILGGGTLRGTATVPASGGVATFADLSIPTPGTYRLTATADGLTPDTSSTFKVTVPPPVATELRFFQQPTDAEAGEPIEPAVQVEAVDAGGTRVTSYNGTITIAVVGGQTLGNANAVSGVALFPDLHIDTPGTYRLRATASGLTAATSNEFRITEAPPPPPPPATKLAFVQPPTNAEVNEAITPAVTVEALDANNNRVTSYTGSITITKASGPGTLTGGGPTAAVNGVATFAALKLDQAGTYTLTASAAGLTNAPASNSFTITAPPPPNQPPTASFSDNCDALACSFTSTSTDADGSIVSYSWNFGDGTPAVTTQNASHTYAAGGTYPVTLTVTDNDGAPDEESRPITVNAPPTAAFPAPTCALLVCTFTDASSDSDGQVVAWSWNFGDGNTSTERNPIHTYGAAGTYTVRLTVTDNDGAQGSTQRQVTVDVPPAQNQPPGVDAGPDESNLLGLLYSLSVTFNDPDDNGPWSYEIDWGHGSTSTGTLQSEGRFSVSHTYVIGSYTIQVRVTDRAGGTGTDEKRVSFACLPLLC